MLIGLLPGLALVGCALLLRAALVRWYDPLRWRTLGAFVGMVGILLAPALFGGRALLPLHLLTDFPPYEALEPAEPPSNRLQSDLIQEVAPHEVVARRFLGAGEWPLWNPHAGGGMPILADAQAHAHWLQPITLPGLAVPLPGAFAVVAGLRLLVALVFTFLLLRRLGLGEGPAFFGAVAFGFGSFLQVWLGWPIANTAAVLPLVLYAVVLAAERGERRDWALLVLAACAVLLSGHPETSMYLVAVAAAVAFGRVVRAGRTGSGAGRRLLGRYAGAALVAGCLVAPALLSTLEYLPQTHRFELLERRNERLEELRPLRSWRTPEAARESLEELLERLVPTAAPLALGSDLYGGYWGHHTTYLYGTAFAGTLTLALALAAYAPRRERFPYERWLLRLGVPAAVLVLARPPGLRHLFAALPLLDRSATDHARVTLLLGFFLAVLAAYTLERWRRASQGGRRRAAPVLAVAGVAVLVPLLHAWGAPEDPETLSAVLGRIRWWAAAGQVAALVAAGVLLLAAARARPWVRRRSRARARLRAAVPAVLALVTFAELALLFAPANPSQPQELFYPQNGATRFLAERTERDRMLGLGEVLRPNVPSVYGLADPRISNPSKPWEYTLLLSPVLRSARDITDVVEEAFHPLHRLLGVRHLAIRDEFPLDALSPVFAGDGLLVYEAPESPLPRLFLPESVRPLPPAKLRAIASVEDFGRTSFAEEVPAAAVVEQTVGAPVRPILVPDGEGSATRLGARVLLHSTRLLASSIYQDGNWHLLANGRRVPTVRSNWVFFGAWLEPGEHRLELVYRPASFAWGMVAAALGLAAGLAWWVPPPRLGRRRGAAGAGPGPVSRRPAGG